MTHEQYEQLSREVVSAVHDVLKKHGIEFEERHTSVNIHDVPICQMPEGAEKRVDDIGSKYLIANYAAYFGLSIFSLPISGEPA
jgi:hypothetical protein